MKHFCRNIDEANPFLLLRLADVCHRAFVHLSSVKNVLGNSEEDNGSPYQGRPIHGLGGNHLCAWEESEDESEGEIEGREKVDSHSPASKGESSCGQWLGASSAVHETDNTQHVGGIERSNCDGGDGVERGSGANVD